MSGRGALSGVLSPALVDPVTGRSFESLPCSPEPSRWDLQVDGETPTAATRRRALARAICLQECAALGQCRLLRRELGQLATGVWAGRTYGMKETKAETDLIVRAWASQAGVTLRPNRGVRVWGAAAPAVPRTERSTVSRSSAPPLGTPPLSPPLRPRSRCGDSASAPAGG